MAKAQGKFGSAARSSRLGALMDDIMRVDGQGKPILSPEIDFIQSSQGLGIKLYPVQRVLTKAIFGIPMDYAMGAVPVWNTMHTELLYTFNDVEYLAWVHEQGRCNFGDWRDLPAEGFHTADMQVGRRGGKSALVSGIAGAKLRNLLALRNPQLYYELVEGSRIDMTLVGTDEESSSRLFKAVQAAILNAPYFEPFLRGNNTEDMQFVTEVDRQRADAVPSIQIAATPCTTRSVRGPSSILLALDEFNHFRPSKDSNSDDFYTSATPSTSGFKNPETQLLDSKTLMISSPWTRVGKMYEIYAQAMDDGISSDVLAFRCSTAEMNHRISPQALQKEFKQNPEKFPAEFGGNFMDGTGSYVPPNKFKPCIDIDRKNNFMFDIKAHGRKYFWWLDLGMKNDATGLAIGHLEMVDGFGIQLIYDYIDRMMVGEKFTGPGIADAEDRNLCVGMEELRIEDILAWMFHMNNIYPAYMGGTDQHGGTMLKQNLQMLGMNSFEYYHSTADLNSKMAFALKGFIDRAAARFPNEDKFLKEFGLLEATWVNKFTLRVQAPNEKNAHDDMSDAAQGVAWLAEKWLDEEGHLDLDPSGKSLQSDDTFQVYVPIPDISSISIRELSILDRIQKANAMSILPPQYAGMKPLPLRGGRRF